MKTRETYAPDDEILYGLIRIAFMLSTGSLDFKGLPKFKELKNFQVESDSCNRVIADLGKAINRKKFERKRRCIGRLKWHFHPLKSIII